MTDTQTPDTTPAKQADKAPAKTPKKKYAVSGSTDEDFTNSVGNQVFQSLWLGYSDKKDKDMQINAAMAAMVAMKPQDEIEGMLAAQMVASHNAAMECFRRAMIQEQSLDSRGMNLNHAGKLTRSYAALLDSLQKYRGKGVSEQKVTVQHVHVSDGGQAIVGNVGRTHP